MTCECEYRDGEKWTCHECVKQIIENDNMQQAGLCDMLEDSLGPYLERMIKIQRKQTEYLRVLAHLKYSEMSGAYRHEYSDYSIGDILLKADRMNEE